MGKLSIVISAYNEAGKIKDCLKSVAFADEIIVIDNTSTDGTGTIASTFGAKVYKKPNNLMLNVNKNYGFSKAKHEWILSLDADERVTPELRNEIEEYINENVDDVGGYKIPRKNIIFGKWIEHTGWYPDFQLRLFRKDSGRFEEKHVHEQLSLKGKTQNLKEPMLHESYTSVSEFLNKFFIIYAPNEAENILNSQDFSFSFTDFISRPFHEFLNRFYFHKGYKDGIHGLVLSLLMGFYHFVVVCYIWERKKFINKTSDSRDVLHKEIRSIKKNMKYWQLSSDIAETKNPIKSLLRRMQRKLLT